MCTLIFSINCSPPPLKNCRNATARTLPISVVVDEQVPEAMRLCRLAGINICLVTNGSVNSARSVAFRCGLLQPRDDGLVMSADTLFSRQTESHDKLSTDLVRKSKCSLLVAWE